LLRHAEASLSGGGGGDAGRPLTLRGREQAARAGLGLASVGCEPDLVLLSAAVRVQQTWERLCTALPAPTRLASSWELYDEGALGLLSVVARQGGDAGTVLVVGHNPVMGEVVELLSGRRPRFGTGCAAVLGCRRDEPWPGWGVALGVPCGFAVEHFLHPGQGDPGGDG